jgi:hypothetical protein
MHRIAPMFVELERLMRLLGVVHGDVGTAQEFLCTLAMLRKLCETDARVEHELHGACP